MISSFLQAYVNHLHGNTISLAFLAYLPQKQWFTSELRLICQGNFGLEFHNS